MVNVGELATIVLWLTFGEGISLTFMGEVFKENNMKSGTSFCQDIFQEHTLLKQSDHVSDQNTLPRKHNTSKYQLSTS